MFQVLGVVRDGRSDDTRLLLTQVGNTNWESDGNGTNHATTVNIIHRLRQDTV